MKLMNDFFENKLNECNIKRYLPRNSSLANYLPFVLSNNFVFISGQLPITTNGIESPGKIKKLEQGHAITFASFLNHRVNPVIRGVRQSLVVWFGGKPFR